MVKGFTPNWFTVSMGTGILAVDAFLLPGAPSWLKEIGFAVAIVNVFIFSVLVVLLVAKAIFDRPGMRQVVNHPVQSMFFGAIPMAFTTIINALFDMGPQYLGNEAYHLGAILWLVNVAMALATGFGVPFWMFTRHQHSLAQMTAVWLMPVVPAEVAAASGAILLPHVANVALRHDLFVGVVALWAFSVPMAFLMLGILFMRLALHKLPPQEMAVSTWITLGTLGTGVMGMMGIGHDSVSLFPQFGTGIESAAFLIAIILWGLGIWWMGQSILVTGYYVLSKRIRFNLGWWGLTFPIGVFGAGTDLLVRDLGGAIFQGSSVVFFGMLGGFWLLVTVFTVGHLRQIIRHAASQRETALLVSESDQEAV